MTKTIIEQADEIVGIAEDISVNQITRAFDDNTYRRGAYMTWLAAPERQRNTMASYEAMFANAIGSSALFIPNGLIAELIIAVHAASKPKGDGLPEIESWSHGPRGFGFNTHASESENERLGQLIFNRFRSADSPVRRFLAAFECVGQRPTDIGCFAWGYLDGEPVMVSGPPDGEFPIPERDVICFLRPRATK